MRSVNTAAAHRNAPFPRKRDDTINDDQFVAYRGYNFMFNSDSTDHSNYSIKSDMLTKLSR